MSGFVGIVNLDGAPVDRALLWQLTRSMDYRGPDAREVWTSGHVGFGHTMLRSTWEAEHEKQPCTVDGECWIAAHCRVDAREELIRELASHGRREVKEATDPELILHAYAVWGTDCVQHIIGDFSFAIWDSRNRRLFCGRDHMGVKLLYYARVGNCLIFGNTLNTLRLHPAVSDRLNDVAIGDFLVFGLNQDQSTTSFQDIQRLPPAHTMVWAGGELRIDRYWTLPIDPPLRLRRSQDYVDQFLDLLRTVVKDRLRTDRVGVLMSGGLDSPGLAAIAKESGAEVRASTVVFDRLIPDQERYYAGLVAKHLGIPIDFHAADDRDFFEDCQSNALASSDPAHVRALGPDPRFSELGSLAGYAKVVFFGEGPDNALWYDWKSYVGSELKRLRLLRLFKEVVSFPFIFRQIPFCARFSRRRSKSSRIPPGGDGFPGWLNPDFAERHQLRVRFNEVSQSPHPSNVARLVGYASFTSTRATALWQDVFEGYDSGVSGVPIDVRHPYVDVRILRYLLALPVLPWCREKHLMRRALKCYLPVEVVSRRKSPLVTDPGFERSKEVGVPPISTSIYISEYIDLKGLENLVNDSPEKLWMNLRPGTFDRFIQKSVLQNSHRNG